MMALNEVKDGDLGLAPCEELLDDVPADEAAAADDEAAGRGRQDQEAQTGSLAVSRTRTRCLLWE